MTRRLCFFYFARVYAVKKIRARFFWVISWLPCRGQKLHWAGHELEGCFVSRVAGGFGWRFNPGGPAEFRERYWKALLMPLQRCKEKRKGQSPTGWLMIQGKPSRRAQGRLGTWTTCMPAATAAWRPGVASSKARHFSGSTPASFAASRNMSGCGLPRPDGTSAGVTTILKM